MCLNDPDLTPFLTLTSPLPHPYLTLISQACARAWGHIPSTHASGKLTHCSFHVSLRYLPCILYNHKDAVGIECDKFKVARVLSGKLDSKISHCFSVGELRLSRHLVSLFRWLVDGHVSYNSHRNLSEFMSKLQWDTREEKAHSNIGFSILGYAALSGNLKLVQEALVLDSKNLDHATSWKSSLRHWGAYSPLGAAMGFAGFDVVESLLCARADPHKTWVTNKVGARISPFLFAAGIEHVQNLRARLARFPRWDVNATNYELGALHSAALVGSSHHDTIQCLLSARACCSLRDPFGGPALNCLMSSPTACLESLELLLERRTDPNMRLSGGVLAHRTMLRAANLGVRAGSKDPLLLESAGWIGMTSLMVAARDGKIEQVRMLLRARADASLTNCQGYTALDMARRDLGNVPQQLLDLLENRSDTTVSSPLPLTPHPSLLTPHSSPLTPY